MIKLELPGGNPRSHRQLVTNIVSLLPAMELSGDALVRPTNSREAHIAEVSLLWANLPHGSLLPWYVIGERSNDEELGSWTRQLLATPLEGNNSMFAFGHVKSGVWDTYKEFRAKSVEMAQAEPVVYGADCAYDARNKNFLRPQLLWRAKPGIVAEDLSLVGWTVLKGSVTRLLPESEGLHEIILERFSVAQHLGQLVADFGKQELLDGIMAQPVRPRPA